MNRLYPWPHPYPAHFPSGQLPGLKVDPGGLAAGLLYGHPELHRIVVRNVGLRKHIDMQVDKGVKGPSQLLHKGVRICLPQLPVLLAEMLQLEDEPIRLLNLQGEQVLGFVHTAELARWSLDGHSVAIMILGAILV